jgi:hypothetical protein
MTQTLKEDFIIARLTTDHSINKLLDSATADTYNRDTKLDERRAALDRYAAWVVGLVDGGGEDATVIPLKSAK